ncbi:50S ribosomal protein L22 [Candidatus Woesebacteria bacterium RIFCSPHIGHO2_01_FULL_44_10]|uniref:Large ribosomal subunit protein uL22 n=1 Tax=Candidatus Woesebacteria bacterium RIFCSPLOWO2_01_FULL_44_14 TaxID=1802525 RepID=A0A1F8C1D2_9BACT|nr:MAG: 50S ribosomal protein L22 [Candidatus Woesebacteria bacterium RIFCSPHIGHO2_01_FULL_44_10]OGM54700.1 MAG: 50S ribosomal protein L22 [Candidatus Woesebacteria bacterium RIFCSPHIGHO2_12_FULL_44_11]OGM70171.1 MAG: 50S ribosomal protein L22 [Candidatus Woesebacteria bacterium RIFCSPLOWO2_01_FULL_44_14]
MQAVATHKYLRMSPRKVREVADMIRDLTPSRALEVLPHVRRVAAVPLAKVIKSAVANAKQKEINETDLVFTEIQVTQGPILKRGRPVSRGQWHPVQKKMSHIRVVLTSSEKEKGAKSGTKN